MKKYGGLYSFLVRMFLAGRKPGFSHCEFCDLIQINLFVPQEFYLLMNTLNQLIQAPERKKNVKVAS